MPYVAATPEWRSAKCFNNPKYASSMLLWQAMITNLTSLTYTIKIPFWNTCTDKQSWKHVKIFATVGNAARHKSRRKSKSSWSYLKSELKGGLLLCCCCFFHLGGQTKDVQKWRVLFDWRIELKGHNCMHACVRVCVCEWVRIVFELLLNKAFWPKATFLVKQKPARKISNKLVTIWSVGQMSISELWWAAVSIIKCYKFSKLFKLKFSAEQRHIDYWSVAPQHSSHEMWWQKGNKKQRLKDEIFKYREKKACGTIKSACSQLAVGQTKAKQKKTNRSI